MSGNVFFIVVKCTSQFYLPAGITTIVMKNFQEPLLSVQSCTMSVLAIRSCAILRQKIASPTYVGSRRIGASSYVLLAELELSSWGPPFLGFRATLR